MTGEGAVEWVRRGTRSGIVFETTATEQTRSLPWVIFVHGVGLRRQIWRPWARHFSEAANCAALDVPGYGESPLSVSKRTLSSWCGYIEEVREELGANRVVVVGESLGGTSSIAYALERPELVAALVLCSTGFQGSRIPEVERWRQIFNDTGLDGWSAYMNERRFGPADAEWAKEESLEAQGLSDPETIISDGEMLLRVDLADRIRSLRAPVLLLQPGSSPFISREHAFQLEAAIPDVELVLIGASRHGVALAYANECASFAQQFLRRRGVLEPHLPGGE